MNEGKTKQGIDTKILKLSTTDEIVKKQPVLVVVSGHILDIGRVFKISDKPLFIGRDQGVDIMLNDALISRRHLRIDSLKTEGRVVEITLEDLGSTNGTMLNGKRINRAICRLDESISVGESLLMFRLEEADLSQDSASVLSLISRDSLTNLYNRRAFDEISRHVHEQAKSLGRAYCLIIIDIDHFKDINDTFGHSIGDKVLKRVAEFLKGELRSMDFVARVGGEEFAIVFHDSSLEKAISAVERLREKIQLLDLSELDIGTPIRVSAGIAQYCEATVDVNTVFLRADQALLYAKKTGRNKVVSWTEDCVM